MIENEVIKAIRERRSIRRFTNEQITDEELQTILEAGTWAATGKGLQDPWIVAVQNEHQCRQLREMNAAIMGVTSDPYYGAPTLIFVFASQDWFRQLMHEWGLPEGLMGIGALSVGYPVSCPKTVKARKKDYYRVIK